LSRMEMFLEIKPPLVNTKNADTTIALFITFPI
jgi:hypothetical protein